MSRAKAVARGALWNYLAQIATVVLQLGYAAVTSRLLDPHLFGVFGAALTSATLINLLALAGLPQIVGRMNTLEPRRLVGLLAYAGAVGAVAATVMLLSAPLWALLWGVPESVSVLRVMAITSFVSPLVALGSGLLLRLGEFRRLATFTFVSNVVGMAVGVAAVFVFRSAETLVFSTIVAQSLIALATLVTSRKHFAARFDLKAMLEDVGFSGKTAVSGTLSYWAGTVSKLALTQGFGTSTLGYWNRAEAITTTPFYQLYTALTQAVYPEFRHDIESQERTRRVWTDMLAIAGWVCFPLGAVVAIAVPTAVAVLFGPEWEQAGYMAQGLALVGGVQPVVFLLISGFEALGRFPWLWTGYLISLAVNLTGGITGVLTGSILPIIAGIFLALVIMHSFHLVVGSRSGLVDVRRLLGHYAGIVLFAGALGGVLWVALNVAAVWSITPWLLAGAVAVTAALVLLLWRRRNVFPPLALARAYGLLKG
ncbi:oligosaccharide flippase family protein [Herbiconiux sp. L3-i23]|uniref:oligosaccharide flippase family protein n=1 Tax=Herbiconiux sp. L3-i23 TaxID=2905871 RepID=UPI00205B0F5F|nr:oligosaccharide flippase family protein [Herbiconiux sp. L3-i23]BDI21654.1 hypothetical protein L3i23_04300 [Herbiconiux sp. L3-i23]